MKRLGYLVAVGTLVMAVSGLSCTGKNSKVASPALKLAKKMYSVLSEEVPKQKAHEAEVAAEIKLSKEKSKQGTLKVTRYDQTAEYEKKNICYIKYAKGEEWGVLTKYDCEDKNAGKKALKRWEKRLEATKKVKETDLEPEYVFLSMMEPTLAKTMAQDPNFDVNVCIEDAASVLTELRGNYLKNRCEKGPSGKALLKKMVKAARIYRYLDEDLKLDGELVAKDFGDNTDDAKRAMKKYIKWVKKLKDDKAKLALALARWGDSTCMEWWYFDNSSAKKVYGYKRAGKLCMAGRKGEKREKKYSKYGKYGKRDDGDRDSYKKYRPRKERPSYTPPARTAPPPSSSGSSGSGSSSSSGKTTGIPECDDFLNKYETCVRTKFPAAVRPAMMKAITKMWDTYRKLGSRASTRKAMGKSCARTKTTMAKSMARYNCTW